VQKKILICDDEPQLRQMIVNRLCAQGFHTIEAKDGKEALRKIDLEALDLIVLDIKMPKLSGLEVLKKLADDATPVPVIVLSGEYNMKQIRQIQLLGSEYFLAKPFAIDELIKKVKRVFNSN
jgi:DNA-binding response OmpR family regulator